jgi:hypothetical protein
LTLEKVERNGSKARRVDLLKLHQPVELMEGCQTWVHFVFDLDLNKIISAVSERDRNYWCCRSPCSSYRMATTPVLAIHVTVGQCGVLWFTFAKRTSISKSTDI